MATTVKYENVDGRVRYQPEIAGGFRPYMFTRSWPLDREWLRSTAFSIYKIPVLYRSKSRAQKVAERKERWTNRHNFHIAK